MTALPLLSVLFCVLIATPQVLAQEAPQRTAATAPKQSTPAIAPKQIAAVAIPARQIAELAPANNEQQLLIPLESMVPTAKEIADLAGISPVLQEIIREQRSQLPETMSLAAISKRQKLIYLREKLNTLVQAMNLQINSTRGKVDAAIAGADETRAYLTERRNRMTHRQSQINLLSGGVTKIVGYSIALAPKLPDIPTNVLEVFDGSVQTSLTGMALRQERQEAKIEHGIPPILEAFLVDAQGQNVYPRTIWRYMNELPPGGAKPKSRRQELIDNWQKTGILARAHQSRAKRNLSIELLDQRMAMLSDLKSVIEEMHFGLMQLNDSIVASYNNDPVW